MSDKKLTRREFVADAGKTALGAVIASNAPMIVPRHVLGGAGYTAPSDMVNFAVVGFGGMGSTNVVHLVNPDYLVAVCDVARYILLLFCAFMRRPLVDCVVGP